MQWVKDYLKYLYPMCEAEYLWEARNGLLHSHSTESTKVKKGKMPRVYYAYRSPSPVYNADDDGELYVLISMERLIEEFFLGIDRFILACLLTTEHGRARLLGVKVCSGQWTDREGL